MAVGAPTMDEKRGERLAILLAQRARFVAFLERRLGSRDLAEEVLQQAFVRGLEKMDDVARDETVVAWFYRLLRNAIVDLRRREDARRRAPVAWARELESTTAKDPEVRDAVCACVSGLMMTLKPEYEAAIRAVDLDGGSVSELATATGITTANASVRLHRARRALGRELRTTCGACSTHGCLDCSCKPRAKRIVE